MKPRYIIEQKITAFVNQYRIYQIENGQKGALVAFAQQKRLAFKEKVTFYADEAKTQAIFTLRAEKAMDIHGRFFVEDTAGQVVGMFRKVFGASLLVSTWRVMDAAGTELYEVKENNAVLAVLRRFAGMVPVVGEAVELIVMFMKYHFAVIDLSTSVEVGMDAKTTLLRDHYQLSLDDSAAAKVDWRTWVAMAVALDALQSR